MGIVGSEVEGNGLMSVRRRQRTLETWLSTESGQRKQNQMWATLWKGIGSTKLMRQHFVFWSSLNSTKSKTLASLHMCFKQQAEKETKPSHESRDCIDSHKANSFLESSHILASHSVRRADVRMAPFTAMKLPPPGWKLGQIFTVSPSKLRQGFPSLCLSSDCPSPS